MNASKLLAVLALSVAVSLPGFAWAQFVPPSDSSGSTKTETPPPAPPGATSPPPRARAHRATPARRTHEDQDNRPTPMSVGVGAGWTMPQSIIEPNTVSVRFRLARALTIEPRLNLSYGGGANTTTVSGTSSTDATSTYGVGLALDLRFAFAQAGNVDFVGFGGVMFNTTGTQTNPAGPNNLTNAYDTTIGLDWGIGVEWFFAKHLSLSADASNPLVSYDVTTNAIPSANTTQVQSQMTIGLIFSPTVRFLLHVYF